MAVRGRRSGRPSRGQGLGTSCGGLGSGLALFHVGAVSTRLFRRFSGIRADSFAEKGVVLLANPRGFLVIEERKKGIAATARHLRYRVKQGAGEHHGSPRRGLVAPRPVLGKAHLAALEVVVQIDRDRKPPMGRALRGVIPVGPEVAAILRRVAGDDVALHARRLEEMDSVLP